MSHSEPSWISTLSKRVKAKALDVLLPRPYPAQLGSYSFISDNDHVGPSLRLLDLVVESIQRARSITLSELKDRVNPAAFAMFQRWPGEHYRLLAGICSAAKPRTVVEIGTASGMSALALLATLPTGSRLVSFDIIPWDYRGGEAWGGETLLRTDDFADGRLSHEVGDLSDSSVFARHRELLASADLIFVDGPKDGSFERVFMTRLATLSFAAPPIVVFDDIRLWNMLEIWHGVTRPKLDVTSFGHWSGTGLIEWV